MTAKSQKPITFHLKDDDLIIIDSKINMLLLINYFEFIENILSNRINIKELHRGPRIERFTIELTWNTSDVSDNYDPTQKILLYFYINEIIIYTYNIYTIKELYHANFNNINYSKIINILQSEMGYEKKYY